MLSSPDCKHWYLCYIINKMKQGVNMALRNPRQDPRRARLEQLENMKRPVSPTPIPAPGKNPIKPPVVSEETQTTEVNQKRTKKED
jgi:hypothetical protein